MVVGFGTGVVVGFGAAGFGAAGLGATGFGTAGFVVGAGVGVTAEGSGADEAAAAEADAEEAGSVSVMVDATGTGTGMVSLPPDIPGIAESDIGGCVVGAVAAMGVRPPLTSAAGRVSMNR